MAQAANNKGKRFVTQQSVNSAIKSICDIMRRSNCAGPLQYVPELTWILFAKNYDLKAVNPNAKSNEDKRTPDELLDVIEAKGREVAEALAALRKITP
jgi:hypothetical protein